MNIHNVMTSQHYQNKIHTPHKSQNVFYVAWSNLNNSLLARVLAGARKIDY